MLRQKESSQGHPRAAGEDPKTDTSGRCSDLNKESGTAPTGRERILLGFPGLSWSTVTGPMGTSFWGTGKLSPVGRQGELRVH